MFTREQLNGAIFPLCTFLTVAIVFFLYEAWRDWGHGWARAPGVQVACALAWIFGAEAVRAGFVWFSLRTLNNGDTLAGPYLTASNLGFMLGGLGLLIAVLRCTYLFTRQYGNRIWVISLCNTLLMLAFSNLT
jgi:hypothetical protein